VETERHRTRVKVEEGEGRGEHEACVGKRRNIYKIAVRKQREDLLHLGNHLR
jgi:hypothetical protein